MSDILWQPDANRIAQSRMDTFRRAVNQRHSLKLDDYPALHQWSVEQRAEFWQAIVDFFDIRFHTQPDAVLREGPNMADAEGEDSFGGQEQVVVCSGDFFKDFGVVFE